MLPASFNIPVSRSGGARTTVGVPGTGMSWSVEHAPDRGGVRGIGALGYGLSIWLDLLALRDLGAAREAVLFASAPFVGAMFSLLVLRDAATPQLLVAAALMAAGVMLLLQEQHSHLHRHDPLQHAHRHRHDPQDGDPHHQHHHQPDDLKGIAIDQPYWHAHEHRHSELEHAHPHVSDAHHRHRH